MADHMWLWSNLTLIHVCNSLKIWFCKHFMYWLNFNNKNKRHLKMHCHSDGRFSLSARYTLFSNLIVRDYIKKLLLINKIYIFSFSQKDIGRIQLDKPVCWFRGYFGNYYEGDPEAVWDTRIGNDVNLRCCISLLLFLWRDNSQLNAAISGWETKNI